MTISYLSSFVTKDQQGIKRPYSEVEQKNELTQNRIQQKNLKRIKLDDSLFEEYCLPIHEEIILRILYFLDESSLFSFWQVCKHAQQIVNIYHVDYQNIRIQFESQDDRSQRYGTCSLINSDVFAKILTFIDSESLRNVRLACWDAKQIADTINIKKGLEAIQQRTDQLAQSLVLHPDGEIQTIPSIQKLAQQSQEMILFLANNQSYFQEFPIFVNAIALRLNEIKKTITLDENQVTKLLHLAVYFNQPQLVQFLEEKCLVDDNFNAKPCPLQEFLIAHIKKVISFAYSQRNYKLIDYCLGKSTRPLADPALLTQIMLNPLNDPLLKILSKYSWSFSQKFNGKTVFYKVVEEGSLDAIKFLLEKGADPHFINSFVDEDENLDRFNCSSYVTPLFAAIQPARQEEFHAKLVLLLQIKINVNYQTRTGLTPLLKAIHFENKRAIDLLLKHGADPNLCSDLDIPLFLAAGCDLEIFNMLVDAGADVKKTAQDNATVLHYAINNTPETQCFKLINRILELEPTFIHAQDSMGWTPLAYATIQLSLSLVKALIEKGADIKHLDKKGYNLLHLTVRYADDLPDELIDFLIDQGINPTSKTKSGKNILHIASKYGNQRLVKYLIHKFGLDPRETDHNGKSAIDYARVS